MHFAKYHGLGNDYLVIEPDAAGSPLTPARVRRLCHRNYGVGADGILLGPEPAGDGALAVRIFNPD
ncbi:MAG: diaminopimelate epimerase, partial [Lentisphaerae bacterium]|nr:diaminopimelate epimerase [Lentisphaerota bacterium]